MEDFLVSMGFRAHLSRAFNVARTSSRNTFHCSPFVSDVETKGDLFHLDVGTSRPLLGLTEITSLVRERNGNVKDHRRFEDDHDGDGGNAGGGFGGTSGKTAEDKLVGEDSFFASPMMERLHLRYQLFNGRRLASIDNLEGAISEMLLAKNIEKRLTHRPAS